MSDQLEPIGNAVNAEACESEKSTDRTQDVEAITHICFELLERIFGHLDLDNLLNVARTCNRLQLAAATKFAHDHGDKVILAESTISHLQSKQIETQNLYVHPHQIRIKRGKILPFLRCFGAKISTLIVRYADNCVNAYINRYCADTLVDIEFFNCQRGALSMENVLQPFKQVDCVEFTGTSSILGKQFSNLANWFPNLRYLEIDAICIDYNFSAASLHNLTHLSIKGNERDHFVATHAENFVDKHIGSLLHANPQLESLELTSCEMSMSKLLDAISGNKSLTKLTVCNELSMGNRMKSAELTRFAADHMNIVELNFRAYRFEIEQAVNVIHSLNSLRSFRFKLNNLIHYDRLLNQLQRAYSLGDTYHDGKNSVDLKFTH